MRFQNTAALIGRTPIVPLIRLAKGLESRLLAKLEFLNPGGSVKDRIARDMLEQAESEGILTPETVVIEPTSGNTGIALAMICAIKDLRCIIVMPDSMSRERQQLVRAYGAEVVLTPGSQGMAGAVATAKALLQEFPRSFMPGQFDNNSNPAAHFYSTGPEIWQDTGGMVDILVAGIGTGGTITGTGEYLKWKKPGIQIIGVEPAASPLLTQGYAGVHSIQGIGPNFVPATLNRAIIDEIIPVADAQAAAAARKLARREGLLAGSSSGAALHVALTVATRPENKDKNIVVILPDSGRNELSAGLYQETNPQEPGAASPAPSSLSGTRSYG